MSSDMSRRSSTVVGGKKMRKRKELDALTGGGVAMGVNRNRRLMCSSDSDSCSSSRAPTPVKLRRQITRRRERSFIANTWCSAIRMFLAFGCIMWIVFEMYTFLDIRKIQVHLQTQLDEVAAGIKGIPDDLQKCHTMSKQLQKNQTDIYQRFTEYDGRIANLTSWITNLDSRILKIEKKIPEKNNELSNPVNNENLLPEVAKLGSNYNELSDSVKSLKDTTSSLQSYHAELKANITSINDKLNNVDSVKTDETMINNMSEKLHRLIDNVNVNVTSMNQTLTSRINWLAEDEKTSGKNIEKLNEKVENLTAQVQTIDSEYKTTCLKSVKEVDSKLISLKNQVDQIVTNVTNLHAQSNSDDLLTNSGQLKGVKSETQATP